MSDRKPQTEDKYVLRFPDGMRDRLKEEAAKNNRSMNAEIIARLEASFQLSPHHLYGVEGSEVQLLEEIRALRSEISFALLNPHLKNKRPIGDLDD